MGIYGVSTPQVHMCLLEHPPLYTRTYTGIKDGKRRSQCGIGKVIPFWVFTFVGLVGGSCRSTLFKTFIRSLGWFLLLSFYFPHHWDGCLRYLLCNSYFFLLSFDSFFHLMTSLRVQLVLL